MKRTLSAFVLSLAAGILAAQADAAGLQVGASDTVQAVLAAQKGAKVTVRVRSGQDITGTVREVNNHVVQLGAVTGKEYFDAVVPLEAVDAIFVRTRE